MKVFKKVRNIGSITGLCGIYEGAIFRIDPDECITIGRDPKLAQIVVDENCELVSRKHCTVKCCRNESGYLVTDFSTNGTFVSEERLAKNEPVLLPKGTVLFIGDKTNSFKLN